MKFYLVHVDGVPQLARTQGDAKAIDKNFKLVEVDVSQQPLMDHLNDLMRRAYGNAVPALPGGGTVGQVLGEDEEGNSAWVEPKPAKKVKEPVRDEHGRRLWTAIEIEEFIHDVDKKASHMLHGIINTAKARLEELEG